MRFELSPHDYDGHDQQRVHVTAEPGDELDRCGLSRLDVLICPMNVRPAVLGAWIVVTGETRPEVRGRDLLRGQGGNPVELATLALLRFLHAGTQV